MKGNKKSVEKVGHKFLWKFSWDCGRAGKVESLFIATDKEIEENLGKIVHFGSILGKDSDVYGELEKADLVKYDAISPEVIAQLESEIGKTLAGYNPLYYIEDEY